MKQKNREKNLAARQARFDAMTSNTRMVNGRVVKSNFVAGAFHRPGSTKK